MVFFPNAKINLGLNIIEKRQDQYHNIESIFLPIPIYDALEITENSTKKNIFLQYRH
jgi:4-diphosphocytidyl-2-C-methyl-D-erythritol kinase